ncbi:S8 family serine peptidase [Streptomyces sp. NPDC059989]|uniref:S8 family serine peptidase n=1 Tax=Streptomyces sp. NPDC059989 TaxID=3347026 RepID=UPI0036C71EB7
MNSEFVVSIAGRRFDPLQAQSDDEPAARSPKAWIVQVTRPLTADQITRLRTTFGLRLTAYVPNLAYIERVSADTAMALRKDPAIRAVIRFEDGLSVSPEAPTTPTDDDDIAAFTILVFPDTDLDAARDALADLGGKLITVLDATVSGGEKSIRLNLDVHKLEAVGALPFVLWVEPVPTIVDDHSGVGTTLQPGTAGMIASIWEHGLHGEHQVIGILDNGPADLHHCFFIDGEGRPPGPDHRKIIQVRNANEQDPGSHATFVAGCAAGDDVGAPGSSPCRGGAYGAKLVLGNRRTLTIFDPSPAPMASTLFAELSAAHAAGAVIHSNSWHATPPGGGHATYDVTAADVDSFAWLNEDCLVLGSSGNSGEQQGPPGTAKNALCVSAATADPAAPSLGDGAPGLTADGRVKPDLMVVGCGVESALNGTTCRTGPRSACASSYATPLAAAAAALVRQYFLEGFHPTGFATPGDAFVPSGALLKAMLLHAAVPVETAAAYPSESTGWGLVRLAECLVFGAASPRRLQIWDLRNAAGLSTGQENAYMVEVLDGADRLKVTLAWTEPAPAVPGVGAATVNNLDLVVTSPDQTRYLGNVMVAGRSVSGGSPDVVNPVETVIIDAPAVGLWTVTVVATQVNVGNPGQGFALAVSGAIVAESSGGPGRT